jgi:hypothetical protein
MTLETEMIALLLALPLQSPSMPGPDDVVGRVSTTGVAVKLTLPGYVDDAATLATFKRRLADRAVLQGKVRGDRGTVKLTTGFGEVLSSNEWRKRLLGDQLVGAGQFEVGATACSEHVHELAPPYAEVSWHAFPTAGDTTFELVIGTLRDGDKFPFARAEFERVVGSARFAVLRLGGWDAMPLAVLDRMHTGLTHTGEGGGAAGLVAQSGDAKDGWASALAAAELGLREKVDATTRLVWCDRAIADLGKLESPGKQERFALFTAQSGRVLALRDAGKLDEAAAELATLRAKAEEHGAIAKTALAYDASTVHALRKEADAAVAALREAIEGNADWRAAAKRDSSFQPIAKDKALITLLLDKK